MIDEPGALQGLSLKGNEIMQEWKFFFVQFVSTYLLVVDDDANGRSSTSNTTILQNFQA